MPPKSVTITSVVDKTRQYLLNDVNNPSSVSPVTLSNITFANISDDIGPIPPPRMFSDSIISTLQTAETDDNSDDKENIDNDFDPDTYNHAHGYINEPPPMDDEPLMIQIMNTDTFLNGDFYEKYEYDEWNSPFVEEVPAKEPQLAAVPKKSALKKPKIFTETTNIVNNNNNTANNIKLIKSIPSSTETKNNFTNLPNGLVLLF